MTLPFKKNGKEPASPTPTTSPAPGDNDEYAQILAKIKHIYNANIKPLETEYSFENFHSSPLTDSDIDAKPMVLLIGQYSTGKTTFIRHILGRSYPGEHIGVEPTTDRFVAVMEGNEDRVIPGNAAAVNHDLPFNGLNNISQAFLSRFQVSLTNAPILDNITIIDTPGILAGNKQQERGYDFTNVIGWFAQRADLILLMFDCHKLDISDEFKSAIHQLKGQEEKVRLVLNKSDMVNQQQLMRVYGAMMWSLGKVVQSPEVIRVYLTSFWVEKPSNCFEDCRDLIEAESKDLLHDLRSVRKNAAIRKINDIIKRARLVRVHALIISHLKKEMPALMGKKKRQAELLSSLNQVFTDIQKRERLSPGDFPNVDIFRKILISQDFKFDKFKSGNDTLMRKVDEALSKELPQIMSMLPLKQGRVESAQDSIKATSIPNNESL